MDLQATQRRVLVSTVAFVLILLAALLLLWQGVDVGQCDLAGGPACETVLPRAGIPQA